MRVIGGPSETRGTSFLRRGTKQAKEAYYDHGASDFLPLGVRNKLMTWEDENNRAATGTLIDNVRNDARARRRKRSESSKAVRKVGRQLVGIGRAISEGMRRSPLWLGHVKGLQQRGKVAIGLRRMKRKAAKKARKQAARG
jgi:hypothetical protein